MASLSPPYGCRGDRRLRQHRHRGGLSRATSTTSSPTTSLPANALAGTAAHLARSHPDQTRRILGDLADITSSALRELKATVGLLRQANDPDTPLEPSPGLGRLSELTAAFASTGLDVVVTTEGEVRPLAPSVDLTAFRIVREALTNVTKHAAVKEARVLLSYSKDKVRITIDGGADDDDKAPALPAPGSGFGVIGMRERASSVGHRRHPHTP
ncbi:hypothetical protein SMIR_07755 [Streptomyces mirabilis]|nr:hypothetical protein SMIR_07755 [Streptomyces mirabilis]